MKNPIVLIEIENGMIQVYAENDVLVAIHDRDTEGNDLGEIDRENNEDAFTKLAEKLDMHTGIGANEALQAFESPTPIDWGKELSKIQDLRDKAKQYIISNTPADGLFIGGFYVYEAGNGDVEIRHIEIRKGDNHITLNNEDIVPIYSGDVSDSDWVQLALIVQETIEGGAGK